MKLVEWIDGNGYKHLSRIRNTDPDEMAPHGIQCDPPNIHQLDWEQIKKDLHNGLVERQLSDWRDVQGGRTGKDGITSAILGAIRRPLSMLYRMKEIDQQNRQSQQKRKR